MVHYLFACSPALGHLFPTLGVVEELVRRGNRVTFVTGKSQAEVVAGVGAEPLCYDATYDQSNIQALSVDPDWTKLALLFIDEGTEMVRLVERELGDDLPDIIGHDMNNFHAGRVMARKWRLPNFQTNPVFVSNDEWSMNLKIQQSNKHLMKMPSGFKSVIDNMTSLLEEHEVDMSLNDVATSVDDFNLVYIPRAFQFAGDSFDNRFAFVGPGVGQRKFLGEWQPSDDGLPVVLVSFGTISNDAPEFFRTCVQAFTDVPWHVVLTLGKGMDPADLGPLPPNIEAHRWLPHLAVLEHARVLVTHGGVGSVMEALYSGRPMVVIPQTRDTDVTADRIAELGLGHSMRPDEVTADSLRQAVLDVAGDAGIAERVREMQRHTRDAGGAVRAVDELEAFYKRATL